jgi:hypothetical protein
MHGNRTGRVTGFDGNDYRKRVLARLAADPSAAEPGTGDPFFVVDLPLECEDERLIRASLDDVIAFWQKERTSVKYKAIAARLVETRSAYEAVLLDPTRRRIERARVAAARAHLDERRYALLDDLAAKLDKQFGGIPRSRLGRLKLLARRHGMDDAAFAGWVMRHRVLEDTSADTSPWDTAIRRQIRAQLDERAGLTGDAAAHTTLWAFLDLSPACSDAELAANHAKLLADNQRARHDRRKTLTSELLAHIKTRLMPEGGRAAYAASLVADAREAIEADVAERAIVTGEVTAGDYQALVGRAVGLGYGLSSEQARAVVREAATSLGVSLAVAPAVDFLLCAGCRSPQPVPDRSGGGQAPCRYCGEDLFTRCPSCERRAEAASVACPHCGVSFRAHREARELVDQARGTLAAGRPRAAAELLAAARARFGGHQALAWLDEDAAAVGAAVAAGETEWGELHRDEAAHRLWSAYARAARLARTAADVLDKGGIGPEEKLAALAESKATLQAEVRAAAGLPPEQAEAALTRILARAADCVEAQAMLARIPIAPPADLRAAVTDDGVALSWVASPAPGAPVYRIARVVTDPDGTASTTTVGTTSANSLEDAGAPGGALVAYELVATGGQRSSAPIRVDAGLLVRDVTAVRVETSPDGVTLTWPANGIGYGEVRIERHVDQASGLTVPTRRIRPDRPSGHVDRDVTPGVPYRYHVYVQYRGADGGLLRTDGRTVAAQVHARPRPVTDLRAETDGGRTTLSFTRPPVGEVSIWARSGPYAAAAAPPDTEVDLAWLETADVRFVGSGYSQVEDTTLSARVVYTPVTVAGGQAVAGPAVEHVAVGQVRDLAARDEAFRVLLTFTLPTGVTEALVRWRHDRFPTGPDDLAAAGSKVTNTMLELNGGFPIAAPADGRPLYVAVYSMVRDNPSAAPVPAPIGATLQARAGRHVEVHYQVKVAGWLRRTLQVEVDAGGQPVPRVALVGREGQDPPPSSRAGRTLATGGGGGQSKVELEIGLRDLPGPLTTLRLFAVGPDRDTVWLTHPDPSSLLVRH